jgi:CubicO group peptidase (beta-lactamase class C family)
MNPAAWRWLDHGTVAGQRIVGGSGNHDRQIEISARELARFGHLILNGGRWAGRQLVPEEWIREATAVQVPATLPNAWARGGGGGPGQYGYNWWRNAPGADGRLTWPGAPLDTFAASGHNNNRLIVLPAWQMVVVRLGLDQTDRRWSAEAQGEFLRLVGAALRH